MRTAHVIAASLIAFVLSAAPAYPSDGGDMSCLQDCGGRKQSRRTTPAARPEARKRIARRAPSKACKRARRPCPAPPDCNARCTSVGDDVAAQCATQLPESAACAPIHEAAGRELSHRPLPGRRDLLRGRVQQHGTPRLHRVLCRRRRRGRLSHARRRGRANHCVAAQCNPLPEPTCEDRLQGACGRGARPLSGRGAHRRPMRFSLCQRPPGVSRSGVHTTGAELRGAVPGGRRDALSIVCDRGRSRGHLRRPGTAGKEYLPQHQLRRRRRDRAELCRSL